MVSNVSSAQRKKEREEAQEKKLKKAIAVRYKQRLAIVKEAKESLAKKDFYNAIIKYNQYLNILADFKGIDAAQLSPKHFDAARDVSELLLISHVYWDLTIIYDQTPKLEKEFHKSLSKFVEFTVGFKYQPLNSTIIKRYIRKQGIGHLKDFKEANKHIFIQSKKCFVATFAFGEEHEATKTLRLFKEKKLNNHPCGPKVIEIYYTYSPLIIYFLEKNKIMCFLGKMISRIILLPFASFIRRYIIPL